MKIALRALETTDAVPLSKIANEKRIHLFLREGFPHPYQPEHALFFMETSKAKEQEGLSLVRAIVADGKLAGVIEGMFKGNIECRNVEIGYWLGVPFWGKSIAARAIGLLCKEIFTQYPEIWRIYAHILEGNLSSVKAIEKAGFEKEACLKQAAYKNEQLLDVWVFAITRPAWKIRVVSETGIDII